MDGDRHSRYFLGRADGGATTHEGNDIMKGTLIFLLALAAGCSAQKADTEGAAAEAVPAADQMEAEKAPEAEAAAIPERGSDAERKSKNGHLVHTVGGVAVDARFGRPEVRERAVWGELVPMGKVWRTGADEATTVAFDQDVTVNGEALPAGVYSLFTVPAEGEWTVIFNKTAKQWGAYDYDQAQDALRVTATPTEAEHVEAMDIQGTDTGFVIRWEKVAVPVTVAAAGSADGEGMEATEGEAADGEAAEADGEKTE